MPYSPPGDLPDPGVESTSLKSAALAGRFFTISANWEGLCSIIGYYMIMGIIRLCLFLKLYNSIVFILEVRYRLISSFHLGTILMCVHAGWRLCPRLLLSLSLCVASVYIGSMLRLTGSDHFLEELT